MPSRPRPLRIAITRDRYATRFNTPRRSRHTLTPHQHLPTHRIWKRLESLTVLPPLFGYDLIHTVNRIPIGPTPYVIGFESHLPRYWWGRDALFSAFTDMLRTDQCRAIVPMSRAAERTFYKQHENDPRLDDLKRKTRVIYPNIETPDAPDALATDDVSTLRLCFLGAHFARKGGCVAVKIAERARQRGLPIEVDIISKLEMGGPIWTDPARPAFFEPYKALLDAPNVRWRPGAPNAEAMAMLGRAHVSLLPTFGDTFGFSAIESMAMHTPVLATRQGALPEFVEDGVNGFLVDLETTDIGEWVHQSGARDTPEFEAIFAAEVERLADEALAKLEPLIGRPDLVRPLREGARTTVETKFDTALIAPLWDTLYEEAART